MASAGGRLRLVPPSVANNGQRCLAASGLCAPALTGSLALEQPPHTFVLLFELNGLEVDCHVIWRRKKEIGVRFLSAPRLLAPKRIQLNKPPVPDQSPRLVRKRPT